MNYFYILGVLGLQNLVCIVHLLHFFILTHFKFVLTKYWLLYWTAIAGQYLEAWGTWYIGIWCHCRGTDFTLSCNKYYLHLLTLFKITRRAMAQVPEISTICVTKQKNWVVSNQWCTVVLLHQISTTSCKVFVLFASFVSTYKVVVTLQYWCAQRSAFRRREAGHITTTVAILMQGVKSPRVIFPTHHPLPARSRL